ncbi:VaFE repeat-containing surface-anchored protein [Lactococcus lactis]|uniref:VaFE repeat-containing surface-anchored protein n=1 Tax=Lactococcus lactis TaxID=1358 RepID=UPI0019133F63|nr:VaFE repeat-containing surface-anchored protein [Lactococcus lactis]MBK5077303.1 VaFE repeat-containing surface-anchored protein [Lactococcus lactis]
MSKNEKPKVYLDWKTGKRFALVGGMLLLMTGVGVLSANAKTSQDTKSNISSVFPDLPTDSHVNYKDAEPILHITLEDGSNSTLTKLFLDDNTPVFCVGLGIPLESNSVTAQADATNQLFAKLTSEQKAIVNNVAFMARQKGDTESYAEGRVAIYYLMDQYGVAKHKVADLKAVDGSEVQDMQKVKDGANDLIKKAEKMRELPSFNGQTIQLIQGVEKTVTDTKSVLPNFPYVKNNVPGLTESVSGNDLKLKADSSVAHGNVKNAVQFVNKSNGFTDNDLPYFIYSTDGDKTGDKSQSVIATKDPSNALAGLNVNVIGLGETTLLKHDADTNSTDTQGEAQLTGSIWGLYKAGTDTLVKYSDGQDGYPVTVTNGEKVDDKQVQLKLTDLTKGVGVKNLDNSADYEWGEVKAPEGYELSTKRYKVHFDDKDKFDDKTSNYIDDVTALDRVLQFHFGFIKAQDVNGSYTGINGRVFRLTPQGNTKGEPIEVTSGQSEDASGFINNGQVNFPNINFGDYLLEELPQDNDKLQLINPISVMTNTNKDKDGNITGYTVDFKDTVTQQVITTLDVPITKTTDNNTMFKVNLGTLVDKPVTPVVPTIKTKAHDKNNKQTLAEKEISKDTVMYDDVELTNAKAGQEQTSTLHRRVKDDSGKVKDDKVVATAKATFDDKVEKSQENTVETKVDTTKDTKLPDTESAEYVWTQEIKQDGKVIAKHDDLDNQDETIYVPKGHTQVATNEIEPKADQHFNDAYYAKGLTVGETYTVKVISAWDNKAKKEVPAKGELTFKATATSMTVQVPVTIDASDLAGHDVTLLEELHDYSGNLIISNKDKTDKKETVHVKDVTPTPSTTPEKPSTPSKNVIDIHLPKTGEGKAALGLSILGTVLLGLVAYLKRNWFVSVYRKIRK